MYLNTDRINVDDFVRIGTAHYNPQHSESRFGNKLHISRNAEIDTSGGVIIGERVTISENAKIFTHDHTIDGGVIDWRKNPLKFSGLEIGDDAWIGADCIILQSVNKIGAGAVIAAGSILTTDVEPLAVMMGRPAKQIRKRRIEGHIENE